MQFQLMVTLSEDKSHAEVETPYQQISLRALDLENLITALAQQRALVKPSVPPPGTVLHGAPQIHAMSPKIGLALLPGESPLVVLAIAFPGLGIRSLALSQTEARDLANRLVEYSL